MITDETKHAVFQAVREAVGCHIPTQEPDKECGIPELCSCHIAARAALTAVLPLIRDAVLEEAARVADNAFIQECCGLGVGSPMECCADFICVAPVPHEIATAIRALKGGGE